jgi:predicted proteasome-type protease
LGHGWTSKEIASNRRGQLSVVKKTMDKFYDAIIIGGGIMGGTTAYYQIYFLREDRPLGA